MAHWHLKSRQSPSGISAHSTMVMLGNIKVMNAWLAYFSFHVNLCYLWPNHDLQSRSWKGHSVHFPRPMYSLSQISKNQLKGFGHKRQKFLQRRMQRRTNWKHSHSRPGWLNYLQVGYNIFYHFQGMPQERRLFTRIQQEVECVVGGSCRLPKVRSGQWAGVCCVPGSKICYLDFVLLLIYFSFICRSGWDNSKKEESLEMALHAACPIW